MSTHWIFGGKKVTQSVYIPEKKGNDSAGDHSDVNYNKAKQHTHNSTPAKKPLVYLPSSYVYPGAGQIPLEKFNVEQPAPVGVPVEAQTGVEFLIESKHDNEVDTSAVDLQTFFEEFRRKQVELEQMVEYFCSVTAIKSKSIVSFQRPLAKTQSVQPVVSKPTVSTSQVVVSNSTMQPKFSSNVAPQVNFNAGPPMSFNNRPQIASNITMKPVGTNTSNFTSFKKLQNEVSQYLGVPNDLRLAFDKLAINTWAPTTTRTNEEDTHMTTSANEQPQITSNLNAQMKPFHGPQSPPSKYRF